MMLVVVGNVESKGITHFSYKFSTQTRSQMSIGMTTADGLTVPGMCFCRAASQHRHANQHLDTPCAVCQWSPVAMFVFQEKIQTHQRTCSTSWNPRSEKFVPIIKGICVPPNMGFSEHRVVVCGCEYSNFHAPGVGPTYKQQFRQMRLISDAGEICQVVAFLRFSPPCPFISPF